MRVVEKALTSAHGGAQIPLWVKRMGGMAVVKVPYANAGQGVWTIVNDEELAAFMLIQHHYQSFIVQARAHPALPG